MQAPIIVVFGITGDLSKRKLLPALYHLLSREVLPTDTSIVGISRRPLTPEGLLDTVELCVLEKDNVCDPAGLERVRNSLQTLQLDPETDDFASLRAALDKLDPNHSRQRLFYMSIPAKAYPPIIKGLAKAGLNDNLGRLLLEKPFGHDLPSAESLVKLLSKDFDEDHTYRIDHYLAKETAQNVLAFRMHNPIFTPLWNADHIDSVHIRALETLGIEGRGNFYEQTGAVRDLIQSHLLQLLALTLMDLPADMSSEAIHHQKQIFLEELVPADSKHATRGQYEGYTAEAEAPHSHVETYAKLQFSHLAERWKDVEIILETGKAMHQKTTDVTIEFKTPHERRRNNLTFRIQPDEGIGLDLVVKAPGLESRMEHASLDFSYDSSFDVGHVDAYERVLVDAIHGDQALFASDREVLATWQALQPLLSDWSENGHGLNTYKPGSQGPNHD